MRKIIFRVFLLVVLLFGLGSLTCKVSAQVPERPINSTVVDQYICLSGSTIETIDEKNRTWSQTEQQLQIGVLVLESLEGQDLETVANETFRKWQIGFSETNNGVLLLISIKDRVFRLETSDRASTILTDTQAKHILDSSREFFRAEDYNSGVLYIIDAISDLFYGTNQSQERLENFHSANRFSSLRDLSQDDIQYIAAIVIYTMFIIYLIRNKIRGRTVFETLWLVMSNGSFSSPDGPDYGSSSDSYGGGDWSGGGGDGGGASSDW